MMRVPVLATSAALVLSLLLPAAAAASPGGTLRSDVSRAAEAHLPDAGTHRYGGVDRYETAARISSATYPSGADTVIIASGNDFPDALAAAPLASTLSAPLLLTQRDALPAATASELSRLMPDRVIVIGGTGVIAKRVVDAITARTGIAPARLSGSDRYATAQAIAAYGWPGGSAELVVATGSGYADALSASPVASALAAPLVLVPPTAGAALTPARTTLQNSSASVVHIVGGEGAVSTAVQRALLDGSGAVATRYPGADRFETSALLLAQHFSAGVPAVFWANGLNFPDAVAGSAAAGSTGSAVALARPHCVPTSVLDQTHRLTPPRQIALGGAAVVSDNVLNGLRCFDRAPSPTISGGTTVGSTLTATPGTWAPAATTIGYQWLRNGSAISGATRVAYSLVAADANTQISVRTTAQRSGYAPTDTVSASRRVVAAADLNNPHSAQVVVNKKRPLNPRTHVPTGLYKPKIPNVNGQPVKWETGQQLEKMSAAAKGAGYSLYLLSGYRSYSLQQTVYTGYVNRNGRAYADKYSARPGHSEHQTGMAVDIYASGYCEGECFGGTAPGRWLRANAHKYGFILRYDQGMQHITGYAYEPWHFRYVGIPVATDMRTKGIKTLEQYYGLPAAPDY
ncbi:cell wall-binding repeat-containing protein [Microbacterium saperdae]|uniref:LAS superfamily LD-carboxypeptidase LdcB n=1 Tax=Microbacterium saperdae TaxID=69368 RepID=A0A543BPA0_9MICO|nr:cell wall-binding repeat-containing protein [Microbacterium saperdae]TQL86655.1 LAS superfamily LD-carboxypeptidase LdcB [Microbacterium saperdae]GGM46387.1 hypothetical protein GCM10010489_16960 [Microbacterium saperdae]